MPSPSETPVARGHQTQCLRVQLTCLLIVNVLNLVVRANQYLTDNISVPTAAFACLSLFVMIWTTWALRNHLDIHAQDGCLEAPNHSIISKFVTGLLISTFLLVAAIGYLEYQDMPLKWTALVKGRHLLVAQGMIVIAGLSLSRTKVWAVAWSAIALHIVLFALALTHEDPGLTKSMYTATTSPSLNAAWEFRSIVTVSLVAYITTCFCQLYEKLLLAPVGAKSTAE